jgi:hypothetical protein
VPPLTRSRSDFSLCGFQSQAGFSPTGRVVIESAGGMKPHVSYLIPLAGIPQMFWPDCVAAGGQHAVGVDRVLERFVKSRSETLAEP